MSELSTGRTHCSEAVLANPRCIKSGKYVNRLFRYDETFLHTDEISDAKNMAMLDCLVGLGPGLCLVPTCV